MNAFVQEEFLTVYIQRKMRHPALAVNSTKNEKYCVTLCGRIVTVHC